MDSSVTHTKTTEDFVVLVMQEAEVAQSVQWLGYRLDDQSLIPGRGKDIFSLCHCIQTNSGAHPASYPMGTRGSFPQG
jgi:hypothetical protein